MGLYTTPASVSNAINGIEKRLTSIENKRRTLRSYSHGRSVDFETYGTAFSPILTPFVLDGYLRLNEVQFVIHRTVAGTTVGQTGLYILKNQGEIENTSNPDETKKRKARFELVQIADSGLSFLDGPAGASRRESSFNPNINLIPDRIYAFGFILGDTDNEYGVHAVDNVWDEAFRGPTQTSTVLPASIEATLTTIPAMAFKLLSPQGRVTGP